MSQQTEELKLSPEDDKILDEIWNKLAKVKASKSKDKKLDNLVRLVKS